MDEFDGAKREDTFQLSSWNWSRVQDILTEALERPPGERTHFLRQFCGDDPALYREVESLLSAYVEAGTFLEGLDTAGATALLSEKADAAAGAMVGPYRLLRSLGRGGMGVVYLAQDIRLDRKVALKFLPPDLAADEVARQRLLTEARAAAALDHPHIGVVHEISETDDGRPFIAMAYYGGETLQERLARAPLTMEEVNRLACQVAEGLQTAHRQGIIHRDIKPSNIIITAPGSDPSEQGMVKIIDFGIARLVDADLTKTGTTLGTAAYMSPEQTRGETVDHRTDIWSLGVVLYEMLTGQRPFQGDHHTAMMYSILHKDPEPISRFRSEVPVGLEEIVQHCLAKDVQARCSSTTEVIAHLAEFDAIHDSRTGLAKWEKSAARRLQAKYLIGLLSVLIVTVLGVWVLTFLAPFTPSSPREPVRRVQFTTYPGLETTPAFSPDGNQIAFSWNRDERDRWKRDIFVKQVGVGVDNPLQLTSDPAIDYMPSWSPDGRHIAFLRQGGPGDEIGIYRIPALGGAEQKLTSLLVPSTISWSPDGRSLYFVDKDFVEGSSVVYVLSLETLERKKFTNPPKGVDDLEAHISPDGTRLAFSRGIRKMGVLENFFGDMTNAETDLYVVSLTSGALRQLTFDKSVIQGFSWTPEGREIVYASDRVHGYGNLGLWRIPVAGGASVPIPTKGDRNVFPTISPDGKQLVYVENMLVREGFWQYDLSDTTGNSVEPVRLIYSSAKEISAEYSPDGRHIVFQSTRTGNDEIWICDRDGRNPVQLTFLEGPRTGSPRWSPDSRFIAFDSYPFGSKGAHLYIISADGGIPRRVTPDSIFAGTPSWSRDGQWIYGGNRKGENYKFSVDGERVVRLNLSGFAPMASPDGKWLYFIRMNESRDERAIWRKPVSGGEASVILENFGVSSWGTRVIFDDGIYYVEGNRDEGYRVKFLDFVSGEETIIKQFETYPGYIHVSPDRQHLMYRQREGGEVDLVSLENWQQ